MPNVLCVSLKYVAFIMYPWSQRLCHMYMDYVHRLCHNLKTHSPQTQSFRTTF